MNNLFCIKYIRPLLLVSKNKLTSLKYKKIREVQKINTGGFSFIFRAEKANKYLITEAKTKKRKIN